MLNDRIRQYMPLILGIVAVIVIVTGIAIYLTVSRYGKEAVEVRLLPSDTRLLVNGKQTGEGTTYLEPGTYKLEASRDGFASTTQELIVEKSRRAVIDIALSPISDDAFAWKNKNQDKYFEFEGRAGKRAAQAGEEFTKRNPIIKDLPFEGMLYTIGYRADPADASGNSIIIEIDAPSGFRNGAINKIRDFGYDPSDFKITFRNYESPFNHE